MKKLLPVLILLLVTSTAIAQKATFGIKMRYTTAQLNESGNGVNNNTLALRNIDAGLFAEFNQGPWAFQPGIAFILKGGTGGFQFIANPTTYTETVSELRLYYLEMPLNITYNIKLKPGKIFFGAGPYLGYALSGKNNYYNANYSASGAVVAQNTDSEPATFGSGQSDLKRFDFGMNALAGFRFNNGLEFGLGVGLGAVNLVNASGLKVLNQTASISAGYFFQ